MRKLKIIEHISLDGVIQVSGEDGNFPYSDWTAPYRTPAGRDAMRAAHGPAFWWRSPSTVFRLQGDLLWFVALPLLVIFVRRDPAATLPMRAAASALFSLLVLQIFLGAQIIWTFRRADVTTAHVIVGALTLAATFWLTWTAHRNAIEQPSAA